MAVPGAVTYTATMDKINGNTTCCTTSDTSCDISDLPCGEMYILHVTAEGRMCNSSESEGVITRTGVVYTVNVTHSFTFLIEMKKCRGKFLYWPLPLSAMRSSEPQSQSELQQQCGLRVMGGQQNRAAVPSDSSEYWWTQGPVHRLWEPVWSDRPALWTALHSCCDSRGRRVQEPTEWQCDDQDRYVLTLQILKYCCLLLQVLLFSSHMEGKLSRAAYYKWSQTSMEKLSNFRIKSKTTHFLKFFLFIDNSHFCFLSSRTIFAVTANAVFFRKSF